MQYAYIFETNKKENILWLTREGILHPDIEEVYSPRRQQTIIVGL